MPRIGIIAGVRGEAEVLAPVLGGSDAPYIRLSGARPTLAADRVKELISLGVDGILSFGSCGGLSAKYEAGSLVVADRVVLPDGSTLPSDKDWSDSLSSQLDVQSVPVLGTNTMLSVADKALAGSQGGAEAVDMESHVAAQLSIEAGVPFAVLRAVVDPLDFEIPGWVLDGVRPDGSTSLLPILSGVCLQPWTLGRLLTLQSYNKLAMEALGSAVRAIGPGFGLGGLSGQTL